MLMKEKADQSLLCYILIICDIVQVCSRVTNHVHVALHYVWIFEFARPGKITRKENEIDRYFIFVIYFFFQLDGLDFQKGIE